MGLWGSICSHHGTTLPTASCNFYKQKKQVSLDVVHRTIWSMPKPITGMYRRFGREGQHRAPWASRTSSFSIIHWGPVSTHRDAHHSPPRQVIGWKCGVDIWPLLLSSLAAWPFFWLSFLNFRFSRKQTSSWGSKIR